MFFKEVGDEVGIGGFFFCCFDVMFRVSCGALEVLGYKANFVFLC